MLNDLEELMVAVSSRLEIAVMGKEELSKEETLEVITDCVAEKFEGLELQKLYVSVIINVVAMMDEEYIDG